MMPTDAKVERLNKVFKNSKFLDRLVVTISPTDTTKEADSYALMEYADSLVGGIAKIDSSFIKEITYKVNDDVMYNVYNTFIENLPLFLEEHDYKTLENLHKTV